MYTTFWNVVRNDWIPVLTEVLRWLVTGAIGGVVALNLGHPVRMLGAVAAALVVGFLSEALLRALEREEKYR